jgi:sugar phosphate isomerase/epimerase/SAM-dependent methyltransferase
VPATVPFVAALPYASCRRALWLAALALTSSPPSQDPEATPAGRTHYLGREVAQTMHWTGAGWLLRETREAEENGVALQRWLAVPRGATVCDLGCGNGYHTLPLARAVGPDGRVFGVELQPQYLVMLQRRAEAAGLGNITGVASTIDDPKLPAASCDLVLMVDVYHELSHPVRVMQHVRAALKPGGRVVLVEFRAEDPEVPIKPEHTMTKAQLRRELASHGFHCVDEYDGLPWQHAMAFAPADGETRLGARETMRGALRAAAAGDRRILAPFLAAEARWTEAPPPEAPIVLRAGPGGSVRAEVAGHAFALTTDAEGRTFVAPTTAAPWRRPHGSEWAFHAMHTGTGGGPIDAQAALVTELGFDGLAWGRDGIAAARRACEERGGDLASAYAVLTLPDLGAAATPTATTLVPLLAPLREALAQLAGGPGQLWLALRHEAAPPRATTADPVALAALRSLLPDARAHGVAIALYPHHDFWLETLDEALRLADAIDDPRLGVCFNLCHHLRSGGDAATGLRRAAPRLLAVTLHGATSGGRDWSTLIRPLDEGDHDLPGLLSTLAAIGFRGPVGLQGFGLTAAPSVHLPRSMAAWRRAQPTTPPPPPREVGR